jgi:hypothetical protein
LVFAYRRKAKRCIVFRSAAIAASASRIRTSARSLRLLSLLDEPPRYVEHLLRPASHFGWQYCAAVEVRTDALGEITPTAVAEVRTATEEIRASYSLLSTLSRRQ